MMYPGLASWATLNRPCGTQFGNEVLTMLLSPRGTSLRSFAILRVGKRLGFPCSRWLINRDAVTADLRVHAVATCIERD